MQRGLSSIFPLQTSLYFSLIYPYLVYCISVWGSTYSSNLNRIFILQKKCIRIISKSSYDAHTEPLFKALRILKFADIYKFQVSKMMFLFRKGLLPSAFCNMFPLRNTFHSYNTRTCEHFHVASYRTNIRSFAIRFQGPKLFNSFDSSLKKCKQYFVLQNPTTHISLFWLILNSNNIYIFFVQYFQGGFKEVPLKPP